MIEVYHNDGAGRSFEVWIPWYKWNILISVRDTTDPTSIGLDDDITLFDTKGDDVTEDYLVFDDNGQFMIKPTGANLYKIMGLLKAVHDKEMKDGNS